MNQIITKESNAAPHLLNVFLMKIPEQMNISNVFPPERNEQLGNTSNEKKRSERYAVWLLLEKAIRHSFGLSMEELSFSVSKGKWSCDKLCFSLSHSHGAAAVAVSNAPCGLDIENLDKFMHRHKDTASIEKVLSRICTENEMSSLCTAQEALSIWTKKESIFKCCGSDDFFSRKIDSTACNTETISIKLDQKYILSVCGNELDSLRCFALDDSEFHEIAF